VKLSALFTSLLLAVKSRRRGTKNNRLMSDSLLTKIEVDDLTSLLRGYHKQAMLCEEHAALLPACIMLASCLETLLLLIAGIYPEEARKTQTAQKQKFDKEKLMKWDLDNLLSVALEAGWLPVLLSGENVAEKDIPLAAYAHVVRRVRNLVHPAKYLKELGTKEITPQFLRSCLKISYDVYTHLERALNDRMQSNSSP
jgi:hypothetical protein